MGKTEPALTVTVDVADLTMDTIVGMHYVWVDGGDDYDAYREEQPMTLRDLVAEQLVNQLIGDSGLRQAVRAVRDQVVKEMVAKTVAEVMAEPFTPTTAYGEKAGEPMTLRGVIADQAAKAMTLKADRGSYGHKETVAEAVIREATTSVLAKELKVAVEAERAKVVDAMRTEGARLIAAMLAAGVAGK